ncbi:response regulator transcription factor [Kribbella sp. CA-293567]|uniref:response regulator transcription factor n=1 Tax=Kribbella sp. CA-293567 TaxID=3002436 RepID=UPI002FD85261
MLNLLATGLSNPAIGTHLNLAPKTVANNVSTIFTKLAVTDRPAAIIQARKAGLGNP